MKTFTLLYRFSPMLIFACFAPLGCAPQKATAPTKAVQSTPHEKRIKPTAFTLESPAFNNKGALPSRYGCGRDGVSPPLAILGLPKKAKTLAFILEDPDAPKGTYTHWIMWNWPASKTEIPDTLPTTAKLETGAIQGTGSNGKIGYNPPCPPTGTHRYFFKAYALDTTLEIPSSSDKKTLLAAMQGHVIGQGLLMATYHK